MRIDEDQIVAPDFPPDAVWVNREAPKTDDLLRAGPVLVEFWDFARVNSLRTLPYMEEWHRRYSPFGASVIGVHAPGYTFGGDDEVVREAIARLGVERPVLLDGGFVHWRDYGNQGWPARYLWSKGGWLRYWHYGEGDYLDCELAIQDALAEYGVEAEMPEPMEPLRPEDAPGVELPAQTADVALPADRERVKLTGEWKEGPDWLQAQSDDATVATECRAGESYAILSGRPIAVPGSMPVPIVDGVATVSVATGTRVHGFQFTPQTG
jgi:hypothetical protein